MTKVPLKLSIMDQSVAIAGRPQAESIRETLALAEAAERLGYHRFWVSEHHNHAAIVGSAPEVLMAAIAARTSRIRIGSSGVMLPHYSALKVAEQFRVLDALAPGRIDLGVGRAPGGDGRTAFALNPNAGEAAEAFPRMVRDLSAWVTGTPLPEDHPFRAVEAFPKGDTSPDLWVLGSSDYGAQVAAYFGLPYCFAHFITDGRGTEQALALYRDTYQPSARFPKPVATACVWALAADTEAEADHWFSSRAKWKIERDKGPVRPLDPPDVAQAYVFSESDKARVAALRSNGLVGTPAQVGAGLRTLAKQLALDELVILTWAADPVARRHSYELLASEFALA